MAVQVAPRINSTEKDELENFQRVDNFSFIHKNKIEKEIHTVLSAFLLLVLRKFD